MVGSSITTNRTAAAFAQTAPGAASQDAIVIENAEMRLLIGENAQALSLIHKDTGQECLAVGAGVPMFTVTQYRPYDNELQLAYPAKVTQFPGQSVPIQVYRTFRIFRAGGL